MDNNALHQRIMQVLEGRIAMGAGKSRKRPMRPKPEIQIPDFSERSDYQVPLHLHDPRGFMHTSLVTPDTVNVYGPPPLPKDKKKREKAIEKRKKQTRRLQRPRQAVPIFGPLPKDPKKRKKAIEKRKKLRNQSRRHKNVPTDFVGDPSVLLGNGYCGCPGRCNCYSGSGYDWDELAKELKPKRTVNRKKSKKSNKKPNKWIQHVKAYHKKHPNLSWNEAMKKARPSYKKVKKGGKYGEIEIDDVNVYPDEAHIRTTNMPDDVYGGMYGENAQGSYYNAGVRAGVRAGKKKKPKKKKKESEWVRYCKEWAKLNKCSYKQAMKDAGPSYRAQA